MTHRIAHTAALLALAAFATCAPAQTMLQTEAPDEPELSAQARDPARDPANDQANEQSSQAEAPGRVGRVSLVEGKVDISNGIGAEGSTAVVNWPVASGSLVTTAPGARTEIRIGSTSVRLDGDSSLEITELDDDRLRLRLHFGSASIRVMNADVVPEFELRTAQATVRLLEPGRLRVDADKTPDTSVVSVLDGQAQVDGGGASLTLRGGRSAEVRDADVGDANVRTLQAQRDYFDDWSLTRDQDLVAAQSARHVGTEMTGYEELDRYGSWSTSSDYGSLWTPTTVAADWTPYRDGQWTWIAPWGWTWVDNAPWGYAPFHYGRWVQVRNRWAWAPGRIERRPVWAPALVGWVGGGNWRVGFQSHNLAAHGWYPLSPYDRFVPGYRLSSERLRRLNHWRHVDRHDGRPDGPRRGLTVVPREHFGGRGPVIVPRAPRPDRGPLAVPRDRGSAPPPPLVARAGWNNERRERGDAGRVTSQLAGQFQGGTLDTRRNEADRLVRERAEQDRQGRERMDLDRRNSDRAWQDPMARDRADGERLARDRARQQEWVARQREDGLRMGRDLDNRHQFERNRFQLERDRAQRDQMRERMHEQRPPNLATAPAQAPTFQRPERGPDPRPAAAPPAPRPAPPPQMVAPPPRMHSANPSAGPSHRQEQRGHTDARGVSHRER